MKVHVETDACIGSGSCVLECPEVFALDPDEGIVVLLTDAPDAEHHAAVRDAAAACPASVISVEE